mmetsp:Transcript_1039/g.3180  ORF Transcript_1039/g.3180 Transcript_1039/m.3180 type:complete len:312 (+) Transcript_1039:2-937(+)
MDHDTVARYIAKIQTRDDVRQFSMQSHFGGKTGTREAEMSERLSYDALVSIYSAKYQRRMKEEEPRHRKPKITAAYYAAWASGEEDVLTLAERAQIAPTSMARIILECHGMATRNVDFRSPALRSWVRASIRDPSTLDEPELRAQVWAAIEQDDTFSPLIDKVRHNAGCEYECRLQEHLYNRGIPFLTEEQVREVGFPKTPDVKLSVPVELAEANGGVINWIESKASFGDVETHAQNAKQLNGYVNRYGPGLCIYWFGFDRDAVNETANSVYVLDRFPELTHTSLWEPLHPQQAQPQPAPTFDPLVSLLQS